MSSYTLWSTTRGKARGLRPILAGRNVRALSKLGQELGCDTRIFDLRDPAVTMQQSCTALDPFRSPAGPCSMPVCVQGRIIQRIITRTMMGPTETERADDECRLWCEVTNTAGQQVTLQLRTPEGYDVTRVARSR